MGMALGACTAVTIAVVGMYFIHWPFSRPRRPTMAGLAPAVAQAPIRTAPVPTPPAPAVEPKPAQLLPPAKPVAPDPGTASANPAKAPAPKPVKAAAKESNAVTPRPHRGSDAIAGTNVVKSDASKATESKPEPARDRKAIKEEDSSAASEAEIVAAVGKAEAAFSEGRMATARMAASQAVAGARNAPPDLKVRAFVVLGKVQLASEQFDQAERSFDKALAIDPQNPVAQKGKERARESAKVEP
jgi:hypothetical protein